MATRADAAAKHQDGPLAAAQVELLVAAFGGKY